MAKGIVVIRKSINSELEDAFNGFSSIESLLETGELRIIEYALKEKLPQILPLLKLTDEGLKVAFSIFNLANRGVEGQRILKEFVSSSHFESLSEDNLVSLAINLTYYPSGQDLYNGIMIELVKNLTSVASLSPLGKKTLDMFVVSIPSMDRTLYEPHKLDLQSIFKKHSVYIEEGILRYKPESTKSLIANTLMTEFDYVPVTNSLPLITADISGVDDVTNLLLRNTYSDISDVRQRQTIITKSVEGLQVVMRGDPIISTFLKAVVGYSPVYLYGDVLINDSGGYYSGTLDNPRIVIGNTKDLVAEGVSPVEALRILAKFIDTLVHEHTHLLSHVLYNHPSLEFFAPENLSAGRKFTLIKDEIMGFYKNKKDASLEAEQRKDEVYFSKVALKNILEDLTKVLIPMHAKIVLSFLLNEYSGNEGVRDNGISLSSTSLTSSTSTSSTSELVYQQALSQIKHQLFMTIKDALTECVTMSSSELSGVTGIITGTGTISFTADITFKGALKIVQPILPDKVIQLVIEYLKETSLMPSFRPQLSLEDKIDFTILSSYKPEKYSCEMVPWLLGSKANEIIQCGGTLSPRVSSEYLTQHSDFRLLLGNERLTSYIHETADVTRKFLIPLLKALRECFIGTDKSLSMDEAIGRKFGLIIKEYMGGYTRAPIEDEGVSELLGVEYQEDCFEQAWF